MAPFRQSMAEFHVIVVINGGEEPPLSQIPFYSIHLNWNFDESLEVQEIARLMGAKINDLITKFCGLDAD